MRYPVAIEVVGLWGLVRIAANQSGLQTSRIGDDDVDGASRMRRCRYRDRCGVDDVSEELDLPEPHRGAGLEVGTDNPWPRASSRRTDARRDGTYARLHSRWSGARVLNHRWLR